MNMEELSAWLTDRFRHYEDSDTSVQSLATIHPDFLMFIVKIHSPASRDSVLPHVLLPYYQLNMGGARDYDRYRIPTSRLESVTEGLINHGYITIEDDSPELPMEEAMELPTGETRIDSFELGSIFKIEERGELYMLCEIGNNLYGLISLNTGKVLTPRLTAEPIVDWDIYQMASSTVYEHLSNSLQSYLKSRVEK